MAKKNARVDANVCVACGACMTVCPRDAISIHRGCFAQVDGGKCVGCGLCVKTCPTGCLSLREKEEA